MRPSAIIIDSDIGGDPDDAIALALAARRLPELALVVTCDELGGERARFARHLLDLLGRGDVPVVAGADLGNTRYFCVEGLAPSEVSGQPGDIADAVERVCSARSGPVRWVGMGPLSNLDRLLAERPELAGRLALTQMGGALRYRDPTRAEHNFRLDPGAARRVLAAVAEPRLVTSDITFTDELAIDENAPLYRALAAEHAPPWAMLLRTHLGRWFARFYPSTIQHDPLTLAAAMRLPYVEFRRARVALDEQARTRGAPDGIPTQVSSGARYAAFLSWLADQLTGRAPTGPSRPDQTGSDAASSAGW